MRALMLLSVSTLAAAIATSAPAQQDDVGDPEAGFAVASDICAACHAIRPDEEVSPVAQAPRFVDVANTPGVSAMALFAWMTTSHPTMPNIVLEHEELRNVVAYVLSLKDQQ